jgi:hypothetical protein
MASRIRAWIPESGLNNAVSNDLNILSERNVAMLG